MTGKTMRISTVLVSVAVVVALLAGCGTSETADTQPVSKPAPGPGLTLPAPSEIKLSSQASSPFKHGSEFDTGLPFQRITTSGNLCTYLPQPGHDYEVELLPFAFYRLSLPEYEHENCVKVGNSMGGVWLGIANFAKDRWDWNRVDERWTPCLGQVFPFLRWIPIRHAA